MPFSSRASGATIALAAILSAMPLGATEIAPGLLYDRSHDQLVVMPPRGGVAAISATDGRVIWESGQVDRPIALNETQLLAQQRSPDGQSILLAVSNLEDGTLQRSWQAPLPAGVEPLIEDQLGARFRIGAVFDNPQQLRWRFESEPRRGALLSPVSSDPANGIASKSNPDPRRVPDRLIVEGGFLVDLGNASAAQVPPGQLPPDGGTIEGAWLPSQPGRQFLAADRQHVLVSERLDTEDWLRYRWTLHRRDGLMLGEVLAPVSYAPFVVTGENRLLALFQEHLRLVNGSYRASPLRVSAYDLGTGQIGWEHEVRDLTYRGPFPH